MGILSSNSTLNIKDSASNGVIILKPTAGDNSTATINRQNAGATRLKALQPLRYATVNASNTLKLNNISLGKNSCLAMLIRIEIPEANNATTQNLLTSVQTIPSGSGMGSPRMTFMVGGRLTGTPNTNARGTFCGYATDNSGTLKLGLAQMAGLRALFGNNKANQQFFGTTTMPRIGKDWWWMIVKRSNVLRGANSNCLCQPAVTFAAANYMSFSMGVISKRPQLHGPSSMTARNTGLTLGVNATDCPENENNLDFIIGGGVVPFDIAKIVKIDASLESVQISGVMMGKSAQDYNLSVPWDTVTAFTTGTRVKDGGSEFIALANSTNEPTTNAAFWRPVEDIDISFGSTLDPKITVNTGSYITGVDNDQLLERDIGFITTTVNKTISAGEVL